MTRSTRSSILIDSRARGIGKQREQEQTLGTGWAALGFAPRVQNSVWVGQRWKHHRSVREMQQVPRHACPTSHLVCTSSSRRVDETDVRNVGDLDWAGAARESSLGPLQYDRVEGDPISAHHSLPVCACKAVSACKVVSALTLTGCSPQGESLLPLGPAPTDYKCMSPTWNEMTCRRQNHFQNAEYG